MLLPFVREIFAEVEQLPAFTRAASHLRESAGRMSVTGLSAAAKALIVVLLRRTVERPFVLVVADNRAAEELLPVLRAFCELTGAADPDSVVSLPARDVLPFQNLSPHPEIQEERATALWKIATGRAAIVISPVTATTILLRSPEYYADLARVLRRGEIFDLEKLLEHLNTVGYSATDVVEMPGQYAARGGILDVYSPEADRPVRVEFFGDEIESMRKFDPASQRSSNPVDEVLLLPLDGNAGHGRTARFDQRAAFGETHYGFAGGCGASGARLRRWSLSGLGVLRSGGGRRPQHFRAASGSAGDSRRARSADAGTRQSLGPH